MFHGAKNFEEDFQLAFRSYLANQIFSIKYVQKSQQGLTYSLIVEAANIYLDFSVESLSLLIFVIDKETLKFIHLDEYINFFNKKVDLKKEKSEYYYNIFFEECKEKGANVEQLVEVLNDHNCLGQLNAYATIIEKYLSDLLDANQYSDWVAKIEQSGKQLYPYKNGDLI